MKTALQELLDWTSDKENWIPSEEYQSVLLISYTDLKRKIKSLLPKEKEQIETAFEDGCSDGNDLALYDDPYYKDAKDYYTKTYKTNEEIL